MGYGHAKPTADVLVEVLDVFELLRIRHARGRLGRRTESASHVSGFLYDCLGGYPLGARTQSCMNACSSVRVNACSSVRARIHTCIHHTRT